MIANLKYVSEYGSEEVLSTQNHTLSFESDNAASDISLGAERIWPDGDKLFGMCSIVRYLTKIRFESLTTI